MLFGSKRLDVHRDVISATLRPVSAQKSAYEVRMRDGSVVQAEEVVFEGKLVNVKGATVGPLKVPVAELISIESNR